MISTLLFSDAPEHLHALSGDLEAADLRSCGAVGECNNLVHRVVQDAPDLVLGVLDQPGAQWLAALHTLAATAPAPVLLFTQLRDAAAIRHAIDSGVDTVVVGGYQPGQLAAWVQVAQSTHARAHKQRLALDDMVRQVQERKAVDRAKGILMQNQGLSDDDAFRALRTAAMSSNQRLGALSQQVVASAQAADALNRAGQLRMLSQRMVKLHLLLSLGIQTPQHSALMQSSVTWVDTNVALLRRNLVLADEAALLAPVVLAWDRLKDALHQQPAQDTERVDPLAQALLQSAEQLVLHLEAAGPVSTLQVLNVAGRQRMLSQRYARHALRALTGQGAEVDLAQAHMRAVQQEFERVLTYLNGIPLSTPDIHGVLQAAGVAWLQMVNAAQPGPIATAAQRDECLQTLARESEHLLDLFDQLTRHYEHSLSMLLSSSS